MRRYNSIYPSTLRWLVPSVAHVLISGAREASRCFSLSLLLAQVSAPYIPHHSTAAQLTRAHLRAPIRSSLTLLAQRSCVRSNAPSVQRIDARGLGKVKRQTARRHGINIYDQIPSGWRGSRGRRGAPDASDDMRPAAHRLWAALAARFPPRLPRLCCRFRGRLCGPAFRGSWRGCPALAKVLIVA